MASKSTVNLSSRSDERVVIFIDGSNLYHVLGEVCGRRDVQFDKLGLKLANGRDLRRVYYYNIRQESDRRPDLGKDQEKFLASLYDTPYVEVRLGVWRQHGEEMVEKGVDVMLATDLVAKALRDQYDTAIVVSGDGDFFPAYQAAKDAGKHVEVAAFEENLSPEAGRAADVWIKLTKSWFTGLWMTRRGALEEPAKDSERRPARGERREDHRPSEEAGGVPARRGGRRRVSRPQAAGRTQAERPAVEAQAPAGKTGALGPSVSETRRPEPPTAPEPARSPIRRTPARRRIGGTVPPPGVNGHAADEGTQPGRPTPPPLRAATGAASADEAGGPGASAEDEEASAREGRQPTARRSGWLRRLGLGDSEVPPSGPESGNG
jgi:uncharacterized LabA/DUF88 family protein